MFHDSIVKFWITSVCVIDGDCQYAQIRLFGLKLDVIQNAGGPSKETGYKSDNY
jgi:hypothetical protein